MLRSLGFVIMFFVYEKAEPIHLKFFLAEYLNNFGNISLHFFINIVLRLGILGSLNLCLKKPNTKVYWVF